MNDGPKSGIARLLIASAIEGEVYRRLVEAPEQTFEEYGLSDEERELLRHPDHRLLPVLGAALAEEGDSGRRTAEMAAPPSPAVAQGNTLPDMSLVLTLMPCAQYEDGSLRSFAYAVWVNPLAEGVDPASLGPPPGTVLPGEPLTPLRAIVRVSAVQMQDAAGAPQVGLSAALLQSTNMVAAPPPEAQGRPVGSPFESFLFSDDVQAAVGAVRSASVGERHGRLIELLHALRGGAIR